MRIKSITKVKSEIVITDEDDWNTYRRNGPESWEQLIGDSWEPIYTEEEKLEKLYRDFKYKS